LEQLLRFAGYCRQVEQSLALLRLSHESISDYHDERFVDIGDQGAREDVRCLHSWLILSDYFLNQYSFLFIKFINTQHSFKGNCSYKTWLLIITRNYCYTKLKQRKTTTDELDENIPGNDHENIEANISLTDAISKLTVEENELLYLKEYAGYSYKEISEILEINVNTSKTKLFKIRKQLKEYLK